MERETRRSNEIYVILEGQNTRGMRYICLYRDLDEALIFVKTALMQLQGRTTEHTTLEHQRRTVGHCVRLLKISDNTIMSQYVIHKAPIL